MWKISKSYWWFSIRSDNDTLALYSQSSNVVTLKIGKTAEELAAEAAAAAEAARIAAEEAATAEAARQAEEDAKAEAEAKAKAGKNKYMSHNLNHLNEYPVSKKILSLPIHQNLTEFQIKYISRNIK